MKSRAFVAMAAFGLMSQSCGTLYGTLSGPFSGGASLTIAATKNMDQPIAVMAVAPLTWLGGTAFGLFPGFWKGLQSDINGNFLIPPTERLQDILDPFGAGMWEHNPRPHPVGSWEESNSAPRRAPREQPKHADEVR